MTFLRIWRTRLDLSRLSEYERFVAERSRPMFMAQRGFLGVLFSRSGEEVAVLSFWEDGDAVEALEASETYRQAVHEIAATGFLSADSTVEALEIHAGVLHRERPLVPAADATTASPSLTTLTRSRQEDAARIAANYDRVADEYVRHVYGELPEKPFDREFLDRFADAVGDGRACEIGCGPGHVARYLRERGCDIFGIDISPRMIELARTLNPGIEFRVADLRALETTETDLAGLVSFYSLIHLEPAQLTAALAALRRTLRPGGHLALAVHEGTETRQPEQLWGIPVTLHFNFFTYDQISSALQASNFAIERITHRAPYPEIEVETNRLYASATAAR